MYFPMQKPSISVLKFGGSLLKSTELFDCLAGIACWAATRTVIIVPGGGEFADTVRRVQSRCRFSDKVAHELALEAMRQCGMIISLLTDLKLTFCSLEELTTNIDAGHRCLWVPSVNEFQKTEMPEDWTVTSDSIALWLSNYLQVQELVLLKSIAPPCSEPLDWSREKYVDEYFSQLLRKARCRIVALGDYRDLVP